MLENGAGHTVTAPTGFFATLRQIMFRDSGTMIRSCFKRVLPAPIIQGVRDIRNRRSARTVAKLKRDFEALNTGLPPGKMRLRPGLSIATDRGSRESFEYFCFRDPDMVREYDQFLTLARGKRMLFDVGALHGVFTLGFLVSNPCGQATAIEPSPVAGAILNANVLENDLAMRTRVVAAAAGSERGTLTMVPDWHHLEVREASVLSEARRSGTAVDVPVVTLDELSRQSGAAPDIIKLDVEGYELAVLRGAREILTRFKPLLFLELHPARCSEIGLPADAVVATLTNLGYRVRHADGRSLTLSFLRNYPQLQSLRLVAS